MSGETSGAGGRRILLVLLAAFLPLSASPAAAQDDSGSVDMNARGQGLARIYENFFRVSADSMQETIVAKTADARLGLRGDGPVPFELYGEAERTWYETIGGSLGAGAGIRLGWRPLALWLRTRYLSGRPVFNVGDVVRTANIFVADAEYAFRPSPDWRLGVEGRAIRVRFDSLPGSANRVHSIGGSIRFNGLGRGLSPEVGGRVGWLRAPSPNQKYRRRRFYVRFISRPVRGVRSSVRYRYRTRRYLVTDPTSSNFGRSDQGGQLMFRTSFRVWSPLYLNVGYRRLDMDSTQPSRIYSAQTVTLGVTIRH